MNYDDYDPVADDLLFRLIGSGYGVKQRSQALCRFRVQYPHRGPLSAEGLSLEAHGGKGISII